MKRLISCLLILFFTTPAYPLRKPHYGGNLRIADTLLQRVNEQALFVIDGENIRATVPFPVEIKEKEVRLDLSRMNPEWMVDVETSVAAIQDPENSCHWILDYPYFDHRHPNQVLLDSGVLIVSSLETDYLHAILTSRCLPPGSSEPFRAFRKTQFGFEANTNCISGRPFLDSITPTPVDTVNPYLSFKLNDVDILPVPEERFQQISSDPELNIVGGPSFLLYLSTSGLIPNEITALTSRIHISEIIRAVLNDHAKILLAQEQNSQEFHLAGKSVEFKIPEEDPYRLIGDRILLDWQEAGFTPAKTSAKSKVEIAAQEILEPDQDLSRYLLLRERFQPNSNKPWYEIWDEMEASGQLILLIIHVTRIAARKNVVNLNLESGGFLNFAGTWMIPKV